MNMIFALFFILGLFARLGPSRFYMVLTCPPFPPFPKDFLSPCFVELRACLVRPGFVLCRACATFFSFSRPNFLMSSTHGFLSPPRIFRRYTLFFAVGPPWPVFHKGNSPQLFPSFPHLAAFTFEGFPFLGLPPMVTSSSPSPRLSHVSLSCHYVPGSPSFFFFEVLPPFGIGYPFSFVKLCFFLHSASFPHLPARLYTNITLFLVVMSPFSFPFSPPISFK